MEVQWGKKAPLRWSGRYPGQNGKTKMSKKRKANHRNPQRGRTRKNDRTAVSDDYECPRCGGWIPNDAQRGKYPGAISRRDNKTEICSDCGVQEALDDDRAYVTVMWLREVAAKRLGGRWAELKAREEAGEWRHREGEARQAWTQAYAEEALALERANPHSEDDRVYAHYALWEAQDAVANRQGMRALLAELAAARTHNAEWTWSTGAHWIPKSEAEWSTE